MQLTQTKCGTDPTHTRTQRIQQRQTFHVRPLLDPTLSWGELKNYRGREDNVGWKSHTKKRGKSKQELWLVLRGNKQRHSIKQKKKGKGESLQLTKKKQRLQGNRESVETLCIRRSLERGNARVTNEEDTERITLLL